MDRADLAIAPARDAEARACRMLLPAAYAGPEPEVLLARGGDGTILGAAALRWQNSAGPPGFPLLVHVVPLARRRGIGRALVEAAAALGHGETPGLWSWDMLDEGSDRARFLAACGFVPHTRVRHYRAQVAALAAVIGPLIARLRRPGRLPGRARIVPVSQVDLASVARLVSAELRSARPGLRARLASGGDGILLDDSLALLVNGELAGTILMRWDEPEPVADAIAIAPAYRGGWAIALLIDAIIDRAVRAEVTHWRFMAEEDVRDTVNLALRTRAEVLAEQTAFYRALA